VVFLVAMEGSEMTDSDFIVLKRAAGLLNDLNGHSCTCGSCVMDEKRGKELAQEIREILKKRQPRYP